MLETESGFKIMGTVNNGWQAVNFVEKSEVDIILIDYHMLLLNGKELGGVPSVMLHLSDMNCLGCLF